MIKRVSFLDILKVPSFSHLTQFDLLPHSMDSEVAPILWRLGFDIDKGIRIQACVHRTVDLQTVVGFSYVCLERADEEWLANKNCSMSARIHSQEDPWLAADLVRMSMEGTSEGKFIAMCVGAGGKDGTTRVVKSDEDENWQENLSVIRTLRDIQRNIRGALHPDEDVLAEENNEAVLNFETQTKSDY